MAAEGSAAEGSTGAGGLVGMGSEVVGLAVVAVEEVAERLSKQTRRAVDRRETRLLPPRPRC